MDQEDSIGSLRSRVAVLVEEEAGLLTQALALSRAKDNRGVDALFAQVQAIQMERARLKQRIGNLIGTQRMHVAAEVWQPGTYQYRAEVGGATVRVQVVQGSLGLQVIVPGRPGPVNIDTLHGTFDGPVALSD